MAKSKPNPEEQPIRLHIMVRLPVIAPSEGEKVLARIRELIQTYERASADAHRLEALPPPGS